MLHTAHKKKLAGVLRVPCKSSDTYGIKSGSIMNCFVDRTMTGDSAKRSMIDSDYYCNKTFGLCSN